MEPEASVVVPIHNEARILRENIEYLSNHLERRLPRHEIILCENGSSDDSKKIAMLLAEENENVRYLEITEANLSEALKAGFNYARSEKLVYFPVDLSVDAEFIYKSVRLLDVFDAVIGSKRLARDLDRRSPSRRIASKAYHGMVRGLYDTEFTDTTCVKAFRRSKILELMERIPTASGIFETELLVEASSEGLDIVEVPVIVEEQRPSRTMLGRRIQTKLEDLLSARLNRVSTYVGLPLIIVGVIILMVLSAWKVQGNSMSGFSMPYTFLLSMLLVVSGFQILTFGLLSNLIMQIRAQISQVKRDSE